MLWNLIHILIFYESKKEIDSAWGLSSDKMIVNIKKVVLGGREKALVEVWLES